MYVFNGTYRTQSDYKLIVLDYFNYIVKIFVYNLPFIVDVYQIMYGKPVYF